MLDAARSGLDLRDVTALAVEMYEKSRPQPSEDEAGRALEDRSVRLELTFQGAGVLSGDLTPECAAVITTVLDALSAPAGADDTRSHAQRYHDALQEALRRLAASGLLPDRAGQPARVWAHISLADLMVLDADSALQEEWIARVRAQWAAARAAASVGGGDGAAWLEGKAAEGFACDAAITPVVTGEVNPAVLDDLVRLCVELAGHGPGRCSPGAEPHRRRREAGGPVPPTEHGREALEKAIIGKTTIFYCTLGRRLTCGDVHDEGIASFRRAKAERRTGVILAGSAPEPRIRGPIDRGHTNPCRRRQQDDDHPDDHPWPAAPFRRIPAALRLHVPRLDPGWGWRSCGPDQLGAGCRVRFRTAVRGSGRRPRRRCGWSRRVW